MDRLISADRPQGGSNAVPVMADGIKPSLYDPATWDRGRTPCPDCGKESPSVRDGFMPRRDQAAHCRDHGVFWVATGRFWRRDEIVEPDGSRTIAFTPPPKDS